MSVCQRKNGVIFVQWKEGGKVRRKQFGRGNAARREAEAYNALVTQARTLNCGPSFVDLCNAYVSAKEPFLNKNNYNNLIYKLRGAILPALGDVWAMGITPAVLDRYAGKRAKSVKLTTIHREICDIRAILNFGVRRGLISHNPMSGYAMPKRDDAEILPLSIDEIRRIIEHSADHLKRAILLAYFCGLRPGSVELLSLQYSQVNWAANTITIISAKKGGVSRREVPIHPALPLLEWWTQDGRTQGHIITWQGKPVDSLKTAFRRAKERAGVGGRKIPLYSLRHSFVSALLQAGIDIKTIAEISGHDERTMLKHYAHSSSAAKQNAIFALTSPVGEQASSEKTEGERKSK